MDGHNAHYDDEGNIIIEPEYELNKSRVSRHQHAEQEVTPKLSVARETMYAVMQEGSEQFRSAGIGAADELRGLRTAFITLPQRAKKGFAQMWKVAKAPCFVPSRSNGKKPKPRSRITLFALDTVRFGGTFALIFAFLFIGINYRSFWNIAKAELALTEDLETVRALNKLTLHSPDQQPDRSDRETMMGFAAEGELLAYLPLVGPPENRLIIPKLGQNIPIVIPSINSLLNEDWTQFEKDIQSSLRDGVVHYPGSAKPGQAGNFFITGHSSYYPWDPGHFKEVFARLGELDVGDTYSVYYGGDLHSYRVTKKYEVKPSNVNVLDQPTDKRISTLMTCTPIGTTLKRLIVQAEEIDPLTGMVMKVGEKSASRLSLPKVEMLPI